MLKEKLGSLHLGTISELVCNRKHLVKRTICLLVLVLRVVKTKSMTQPEFKGWSLHTGHFQCIGQVQIISEFGSIFLKGITIKALYNFKKDITINMKSNHWLLYSTVELSYRLSHCIVKIPGSRRWLTAINQGTKGSAVKGSAQRDRPCQQHFAPTKKLCQKKELPGIHLSKFGNSCNCNCLHVFMYLAVEWTEWITNGSMTQRLEQRRYHIPYLKIGK